MNELFKMSSVSKIFKMGEIEIPALSNVNLHIHQGEFMALVGPSGSGKSTLLNIMSGLDFPTQGDVFLQGENLSHFKTDRLSDFRRDHIGLIFQSYNLIPVLTVKENVEYIMLLQGHNERDRGERVAHILKEVSLDGLEDRFPRQLSGGQQQRVAVARAIVARPEIVLADEPTANLDLKTGTELIELMAKLNKEYGTTFVFSTHDPKIMKRAKRLVTLEDGKIISDETFS